MANRNRSSAANDPYADRVKELVAAGNELVARGGRIEYYPALQAAEELVIHGKRVHDPELYRLIVVCAAADRVDPSLGTSYIETSKRFAKAARLALEVSFEKRIRVGKDPRNSLHKALRLALASDTDGSAVAWVAREMLGLKLGELLPPGGPPNAAAREFMETWRTLPPIPAPKVSHHILRVGKLPKAVPHLPIAEALNTFVPPDTWSDDPEAFMRLATNLQRMANWLAKAAGKPVARAEGGRPSKEARTALVTYARTVHELSDRALARLIIEKGFDDAPDDLEPLAKRKSGRIDDLSEKFRQVGRIRADKGKLRREA